MRRSGKYAYVDGIGCTGAWSTTRRSSIGRYFASCVPGASGATEGVYDETGAVRGFGYLPPMPSEDAFAFVGVASAKAAELVNYEGDVLFDSVTLNIPVSSGAPINWSANFGVQGFLNKETATPYQDESREVMPSGKHGRVTVENTPDNDVFTEVHRVQNITLNFRRPASISVDAGLTERETGNLEVDINFDVHNDDLETQDEAGTLPLCEIDSVKRVRVYVTDTLFYEFDAIIFGEHSNFNVDRTSNPPPIIGYSISGMWTALRDRDPPELGQILLPGGEQFYGPGST